MELYAAATAFTNAAHRLSFERQLPTREPGPCKSRVKAEGDRQGRLSGHF